MVNGIARCGGELSWVWGGWARGSRATFSRRVAASPFYNRTLDKMAPFVAAGATAARTPREAAATADIVVTCLMDDRSVLDTLQGEDGILAGMRPGRSTSERQPSLPSASTRCAELHAAQGSHYVAAPVGGLGRMRRQREGCSHLVAEGGNHRSARGRSSKRVRRQMTVVGEDPASAASIKLVETSCGRHYRVGGRGICIRTRAGVLAPYSNLMKSFQPWMREHAGGDRDAELVAMQDSRWTPWLKDVGLILDAAAGGGRALAGWRHRARAVTGAQARGMNEKDWCCFFTEMTRSESGAETGGLAGHPIHDVVDSEAKSERRRNFRGSEGRPPTPKRRRDAC